MPHIYGAASGRKCQGGQEIHGIRTDTEVAGYGDGYGVGKVVGENVDALNFAECSNLRQESIGCLLGLDDGPCGRDVVDDALREVIVVAPRGDAVHEEESVEVPAPPEVEMEVVVRRVAIANKGVPDGVSGSDAVVDERLMMVEVTLEHVEPCLVGESRARAIGASFVSEIVVECVCDVRYVCTTAMRAVTHVHADTAMVD